MTWVKGSYNDQNYHIILRITMDHKNRYKGVLRGSQCKGVPRKIVSLCGHIANESDKMLSYIVLHGLSKILPSLFQALNQILWY